VIHQKAGFFVLQRLVPPPQLIRTGTCTATPLTVPGFQPQTVIVGKLLHPVIQQSVHPAGAGLVWFWQPDPVVVLANPESNEAPVTPTARTVVFFRKVRRVSLSKLMVFVVTERV
jgi:hypothetical protein